jgi:hypothetical protein
MNAHVILSRQAIHCSGRITGATSQPASARTGSRHVDSVVSANQARHAKEPGRLGVGGAGARLPPFTTRIGVRVKRSDDHAPCHNWRHSQVQGCFTARRSPAHRDGPFQGICVDPATLFVPTGWIGGQRIHPGLGQCLLHGRFVQQPSALALGFSLAGEDIVIFLHPIQRSEGLRRVQSALE